MCDTLREAILLRRPTIAKARWAHLDRIVRADHNCKDMSSEVQVHQRLWKMDERRYVTAIVKATFAIRPDGQLAQVVASAVNTEDKTERDLPMASIREAREDMPYLARPEVVLRADAYSDESGTQGRVQMLVTRGETVLIDKSAIVYGKRASLAASPCPFERILLGYERALGGIGFADNPLGTGSGSMTNKLPNIVHPEEPEVRTIGFGALGDAWPSRKKLRNNFSFKNLKARVVEIPTDIDWTCFQVAPADQQLDELCGNESFRLSGVRPNGEVLVFALPSVCPYARVSDADALHTDEEIALRLDTVSIDAISSEVSLVWRGYVAVAAETDFEEVRVVAGLNSSGRSVTREGAQEEVAEDFHDETVLLAGAAPRMLDSRETGNAADIEMIRRGAMMPFQPGAKPTVQRKVAQTAAAYIAADDEEAYTGTVELSSSGSSNFAAALPFDKPLAPDEGGGPEMNAAAAAQADKERLEAEIEEQARLEAEAESERQAEREANDRRQASAEVFERAQAEAKEAEKQRAALKEQRRQEKGKAFRAASYGGLGRRKKR